MNKRTQKKLLKAMRNEFISHYAEYLTENEKFITDGLLCNFSFREYVHYYYFTVMGISSELRKPCFKVSEVYVNEDQSRFYFERYFPCTIQNYKEALFAANHFNLEHYEYMEEHRMVKNSEKKEFSE